MTTEVKENLFESVTELEDSSVRVSFTNGDALFTKEKYLLYRQKIDRANKFYKKRAEKESILPCQDKRHLQILYTIYNREFESIAKGMSESQKVPYFKEIKISDEAYKKANLIAKRMYALAGDNEIYLHMLNSIKKRKQGDFVLRDVYIPGGQIVTPVTCSLKNPHEKRRDSIKILENGEYISGWAHSHARMQTFHSGTDRNNLLTEVLNGTMLKVAPDPFGTGKVQEYSFRFFPSMVFNALGDLPSCAIAIDYPHFILGKGLTMKTYTNFSPRLRIKKEINNINLNFGFVDEEIKTRVLPYNPRISVSQEKKARRINPKVNLEKKIPKKTSRKIASYRVLKRLEVLEDQAVKYEEVYNKLIFLEKENKILRKKIKNLEDIIGGEDDYSAV